MENKNENELTLLENIKPIEVFSEGGSDLLLEKIKKKVDEFESDVTSDAGRKKIKSFAYEIARSKTALDAMGQSLVVDWKKKSSLVDKERKKIKDFFDDLKEKVRKPLTDFEDAEAERVTIRESRIVEMERLSTTQAFKSTYDVKELISQLEELIKFDWQEFEFKAKTIFEKAELHLNDELEKGLKYEAEEAELSQLRKEKQERDQKDRDDKIASDAAEKAKREAEEKAESEKRELEAEKKAAEQAKIDAENRAIEAEKKAAEDIKLAAEEATKKERERVEAKKVAEDAASAKIAANMEHREKINGEIQAKIANLLSEGWTFDEMLGPVINDVSELIVKEISEGNIPHLSIKY